MSGTPPERTKPRADKRGIRQPSKTPHIKSWPAKYPPAPSRPTRDTSRKRHDDDSLWGKLDGLQQNRQRRIATGELSEHSGCKICGSSARGMGMGYCRHKICNTCLDFYLAALKDSTLSVEYTRHGITITQYEDILDRIKALLLRFIDWLNSLGESFGERHPRPRPLIPDDDKHIADGEHMATLAELFDEVDERQRPPRTEAPGYTICKR